MGQENHIEYIDMPDGLRDRYQYYTQAEMAKLAHAGCPITFTSLEDAVTDYIQHYLQGEDPYL